MDTHDYESNLKRRKGSQGWHRFERSSNADDEDLNGRSQGRGFARSSDADDEGSSDADDEDSSGRLERSQRASDVDDERVGDHDDDHVIDDSQKNVSRGTQTARRRKQSKPLLPLCLHIKRNGDECLATVYSPTAIRCRHHRNITSNPRKDKLPFTLRDVAHLQKKVDAIRHDLLKLSKRGSIVDEPTRRIDQRDLPSHRPSPPTRTSPATSTRAARRPHIQDNRYRPYAEGDRTDNAQEHTCNTRGIPQYTSSRRNSPQHPISERPPPSTNVAKRGKPFRPAGLRSVS